METISRHHTLVLCVAGLGAGMAVTWLLSTRRKKEGKLEMVGEIYELCLYPIKSCKGISVREAECTEFGLKSGPLRDRHWVVINKDKIHVSARHEPRMVLINVSCEKGLLTFNAPDMEELSIPLKLPSTNEVITCKMYGHAVQGRDCGAEISQWITSFLGNVHVYRLIQFEAKMKPRNPKKEYPTYTENGKFKSYKVEKDPPPTPSVHVNRSCSLVRTDAERETLQYAKENPALLYQHLLTEVCPSLHLSGLTTGFQIQSDVARRVLFLHFITLNYKQIAYPELSPLLLLSEASVEDLNSKLERKITFRYFRPNILISGCGAFDEDTWKEIQIGSHVILKRVMPCPRCKLTTIDPDTGILHNKEPLDTLRSYRLCETSDKELYKSSPLFGQFFKIEKKGVIKVGDPVYQIIY